MGNEEGQKGRRAEKRKRGSVRTRSSRKLRCGKLSRVSLIEQSIRVCGGGAAKIGRCKLPAVRVEKRGGRKSGCKTDQEQQMSNQFLYRNDDSPWWKKCERETAGKTVATWSVLFVSRLTGEKLAPPLPAFPLSPSRSLCFDF